MHKTVLKWLFNHTNRAIYTTHPRKITKNAVIIKIYVFWINELGIFEYFALFVLFCLFVCFVLFYFCFLFLVFWVFVSILDIFEYFVQISNEYFWILKLVFVTGPHYVRAYRSSLDPMVLTMLSFYV